MSAKTLKFTIFVLTAFFCVSLFAPFAAQAQRRDFLTEQEADLIREAQAIDQRTEVFVKAIDRRFLVLNNQAQPDDKKLKKDSEKWGELPAGTRLELLTDIRKILDEAISNIDDVAAHNKMDEKLFPKAVRKLAEASNRYLSELKSDLTKTADEKEKGAILASIEYCEQVIEASAKVPKEETKKKN
ncbi:MAG: hypothetical protein M3033_14425 [Acidobacteriota bacterium]|nr:hypothetical protein [Acidobacteriota bacterium]